MDVTFALGSFGALVVVWVLTAMRQRRLRAVAERPQPGTPGFLRRLA
ncbi:MAG TPA: hypothetical protein VMH02_12960 [Verrucomicrobiae bacterium]|nr:hypothetical protein [Verrucomicrobiae bacterium]